MGSVKWLILFEDLMSGVVMLFILIIWVVGREVFFYMSVVVVSGVMIYYLIVGIRLVVVI